MIYEWVDEKVDLEVCLLCQSWMTCMLKWEYYSRNKGVKIKVKRMFSIWFKCVSSTYIQILVMAV